MSSEPTILAKFRKQEHGSANHQHVYIRALNPYAFRAEQWARIVGVVLVTFDGDMLPKPCYTVQFIDGVEDEWPIFDTVAEYEFRVGNLAPA